MVVVALLSVDLVESVDLVFVDLVVNCTYLFLSHSSKHCLAKFATVKKIPRKARVQ